VIYLVQAGKSGPVKVGWASDYGNVARRVGALQVGNHDELHLLATLPGGRDRERALHEQFASDRIRGEWFRPTPELLGLASVAAPPPARDSQRWATKLHPLAAEEIRTSQQPASQLAATFGVSKRMINLIRAGKRWPSSERVR
jgi:hypothetical protein